MSKASSPSSTGPAGSHFEGQVGASYLLSMLVGAEPRGLPGTTIGKIALQRAPEGSPLDDVIVYAHDAQGNPAKLEVQVKKSMTFAPGDKVFREVVGQIVKASRNADFNTLRTRHRDFTELPQYRRSVPDRIDLGSADRRCHDVRQPC
jgi:hypothetical protein